MLSLPPKNYVNYALFENNIVSRVERNLPFSSWVETAKSYQPE